MVIDQAIVRPPGITLIHVKKGKKQFVKPGVHAVEQKKIRVSGLTRNYILLRGTDFGSIESWWLQKESDGTIELKRLDEGQGMTLDGVPLPITSSAQLSKEQLGAAVCGHLVKGRFVCMRCTSGVTLTYPDAIAITPRHILPYSQSCSKCGLRLFDVMRNDKHQPVNLFK